jgi:hypothetical protein
MRSTIAIAVLLAVLAIGCGNKSNQGVDKPANPAPAPTSKGVES